jgi:diguanylate cyclase (GGDEF)-like protein
MKKYNVIKTLQLVFLIVLAVACLAVVLLNADIFHLVANDGNFRLICIMLWLVLAVSFIFIFLDFNFLSSYKRDFSELDYAVHSDPVAGIANRYSCDALIERYLDKPLDPRFGCIMLEITNLWEINQLYGHTQGNELIREFSAILHASAVDVCFVGRNGGNKFLALFEEGSQEKMNFFLTRVKQKVELHNDTNPRYRMDYLYGVAFEEGDAAPTITDLIALANHRIYKGDTPAADTDTAQ